MQYDLLWISKHTTQSYPLTDLAYALGIYKKQIPMSFLLDIQIKVPKRYLLVLRNSFYIKNIVCGLDTYSIIIGAHIASGVDFACLLVHGISKNIDLSTPMLGRYYILIAGSLLNVSLLYRDMLSKLTGIVYVGVTKGLLIPSMLLTYLQGAISPVCVQTIAGLEALIVGDKAIQGTVRLHAGTGINIDVQKLLNLTVLDISIDPLTIYTGIGSVLLAVQEIKAALGLPILFINGVSPDSNGNVNIAGLDCVRFAPADKTTNVITVSNTCSKPCCGTVYSDAIKNQILVIKELQSVLRDYFVQQSNNINYIQASLATVIGSK